MQTIDKDKLKEMIDILDVVSEYVAMRRSGSSYFGLCPFHSERTPSFTVNQQKQHYRCYGCGEGGDVFSFLMKIETIEFKEALQKVKERLGLDGQNPPAYKPRARIEAPVSKKLDDKQLDEISRELQSVLTLSHEHKNLLMSPTRGMTQEEIEIRGYRSFPEKPWEPFTKLARSDFEGFPGAYMATRERNGVTHEYWSLKGYKSGGILIPIRNERNYIVGWQVRLDKIPDTISYDSEYKDKFHAHLNNDGIVQVIWQGTILTEIPANRLIKGEKKKITVTKGEQKITLGEIEIRKGQKYFWLSSPNKPKGAEAGNPLPIHVAVPSAIRQILKPGQLLTAKKCWITEGPIKADIAAEKIGEPFIGVPGLSSWRQAMNTITNMGITHAVLAFDMDIARKEELRDQIKIFKEELYKLDHIKQCDVALWNEDIHGKGIDDILIRNLYPEVRTLFKK
jgi:hypothetical protein